MKLKKCWSQRREVVKEGIRRSNNSKEFKEVKEAKEIKEVKQAKEIKEVKDGKTEVEPSAQARYSSPLQWSMVPKCNSSSSLSQKSYDTSRL